MVPRHSGKDPKLLLYAHAPPREISRAKCSELLITRDTCIYTRGDLSSRDDPRVVKFNLSQSHASALLALREISSATLIRGGDSA